MDDVNRADAHTAPCDAEQVAANAKPDYLPPEITTLTEADILHALGPAHTGSMENPFGTDGLGGM